MHFVSALDFRSNPGQFGTRFRFFCALRQGRFSTFSCFGWVFFHINGFRALHRRRHRSVFFSPVLDSALPDTALFFRAKCSVSHGAANAALVFFFFASHSWGVFASLESLGRLCFRVNGFLRVAAILPVRYPCTFQFMSRYFSMLSSLLPFKVLSVAIQFSVPEYLGRQFFWILIRLL